MTALSKPDGGVRGIVVGDIFRRLVARTIAKQVAEKGRSSHRSPSSTPLSTKAGCECVAHILQTLTDLDPETTIMSIDGVASQMEGGDQILPFVRAHQPYLWEDEMGVTQSIPQGEGGEQGDPLMPMLFALGQQQGSCSDPGKDEARRTRDGVLG